MGFPPSGGGTQGTEIGYDQITTASITISSSTEATGTTIIACAAHVFDGAAVLCELFIPECRPGATAGNNITYCLFEGATEIGQFCQLQTPAAANDWKPAYGAIRFTPTAGSHTYTVTAFQTGGNGTSLAGAGGTATLSPAFCRFTKV